MLVGRSNPTYYLILTLTALFSLSACHGVLDELYDKPKEGIDVKEGQLYIDASSWTDWFFIDFNAANRNFAEGGTGSAFVKMGIPLGDAETKSTKEHPVQQTGIYTYWYDVFGKGVSNNEFDSFKPAEAQPEPETWHIAVHRNNVRTNGGAVYETTYTSMKSLPESSEAFADATFTEDEWNELDVWTIQKQMLNGLIGNQGIAINPVLSRWLSVEFPPPPTFKLNNHVFIVRFNDGTYAAVQLENYQNPAGVKCWLTINYKYPY